jgi:hypothetical protein
MGSLVSQETEIEHDGELLILKGFESAILGYGSMRGMEAPVVVYDKGTCINIIQGESMCSEEEAENYFTEVVLDRDLGPGSPFFVSLAPVQEH